MQDIQKVREVVGFVDKIIKDSKGLGDFVSKTLQGLLDRFCSK